MADNPFQRTGPPIDPPTTAATWVMPNAASAAMSASTWSRTVIVGNLEPHGFPSRASELGPVEPRQPPSTLVATAHQRSVSIGAPGPATPSHQPGVGCPGPAGPVMCESPVRACSTTTTLSRLGDNLPQRCTAMQTSSITAPLSRRSEPMSTRPISPSAGSVWVGTSEIVTSELLRRRPRPATRR
ncbi:homoserine O-acetyltransferase domain protein [Mycobacterium kansasii]|uniref:Homoserine O-acetyltransferase domain protein n=1 Tax=Mycobacterium kansasii TaxID=1768 RepID=A0A1V3Y073_MYCKA|nr:homoserine O-acetyltransferase domain protein [Mycobacterium kansasii]